MRSSIAWSILVGNEVWVAKIFLQTYFQVFLGQTCCFWHVFSWGAWVSESQTLIFERYGSTTWPILVRYEPWVAKNFLHMYCQSFGSIHVASRWVFKITGSHYSPLETMIPDFWKSCISQQPSGQLHWYIAGIDAHGMCIIFLNLNAAFQNIFWTLIFAPWFGAVQTKVHTLPFWAFVGFHSATKHCKELFMRFAAPYCTVESDRSW